MVQGDHSTEFIDKLLSISGLYFKRLHPGHKSVLCDTEQYVALELDVVSVGEIQDKNESYNASEKEQRSVQ